MAFDKRYFGDFEGFMCLNNVLKHFGMPLVWDLFTLESSGARTHQLAFLLLLGILA